MGRALSLAAGMPDSVEASIADLTVPQIKFVSLQRLRNARQLLAGLCAGGDQEACQTLGVYDRMIRGLELDIKREEKRGNTPATQPVIPASQPAR